VSAAVGAGGKLVYVARMPVRLRGDVRVGTAAVRVDPRHDAMVTILETDVDRIDLICGRQGLVEHFPASFGLEEVRVGHDHLGHDLERAGNRADQVVRRLDAVFQGSVDLFLQNVEHRRRIPLIVEDQDEHQDGDDQDRQSHRDDRAQAQPGQAC